jgi:hypothetical protein
MLPHLRPLLVEYCEYLLQLGRADRVLGLIDQAPKDIRAHSRVQFLEARAGLALRMPARWEKVLGDGYELVDIREGESSLTDFWVALARAGAEQTSPALDCEHDGWHVHAALPRQLDFRVTPTPHFELLPERKESEATTPNKTLDGTLRRA